MTLRPRVLRTVASVAATVALWVPLAPAAVASLVAEATCSGVTVVVDPASLGGAGAIGCAPSTGAELTAREAATSAGIAIEGTAQWGAAFVCRVDGRPGPDEDIVRADGSTSRETCARTPPHNASWALWSASEDDWEYATVGALDLRAGPGDVVGLAFSVGPEPAAPAITPADARSGVLPPGWSVREGDRSGGADPAGTASGAAPVEQSSAGVSWQQATALALVAALVLVTVLLSRRRGRTP